MPEQEQPNNNNPILGILISALIAVAGFGQELPNRLLTPGAVLPTATHDVCQPGYSRARRVNFSIPVRRYVFDEYGTTYVKGAFEFDHLISLEIGGSNGVSNLWPEPYHTLWNAHVKDALEDRLHALVCDGNISLRRAQIDISTNWIEAYKRYFRVSSPIYAQHVSSRRRVRSHD